MDKKQIMQALDECKPILEKQGIELLGLFGSYARDEATDQSDIDVLIQTTEYFVRNTDPLKAFTILRSLQQTLENKLAKKVDLVDKAGLNEIGRQFILKEVLYVRDRLLTQYCEKWEKD